MFRPKRIIFEKNSLEYEIGEKIYNIFKGNSQVEIIRLNSNRIKENIPNNTLVEFYNEGKSTLVVGVKKGMKFQSCKPSAHYQLPLVSGCMGKCQYCYLNTNLGDKPFLRVNVNIEDILDRANSYMMERFPDITIFEGAATSDPVPVEVYTGALAKTIEFFGASDKGRFRFVTKYNDIDTLLRLNHNGKTDIRVSLNTPKIIESYEIGTASSILRIEAIKKLSYGGYPIGVIIAPVFIYDGWKRDYRELLIQLENSLPRELKEPITFEVISHRYTTRAKNIINEVFPNNTLPMDDEKRKYKYGQFGYGKFVYTKEELQEIKEFFNNEIENIFHNKIIKYII